jgi:hypothetical protein
MDCLGRVRKRRGCHKRQRYIEDFKSRSASEEVLYKAVGVDGKVQNRTL